MYLLTTNVEIAAPPATVRQMFLDFSSIPKYTPNGFVRSIAPAEAEVSPDTLKPGDKLNCVVGYGKMQLSPILKENTSSVFSWTGSFLGIFVGEHRFCFEEIPGEPSRTRFVHEERFSGLISFIIGDNLAGHWIGLRKETQEGFEGFNRDFKAWVEQAKSGNALP